MSCSVFSSEDLLNNLVCGTKVSKLHTIGLRLCRDSDKSIPEKTFTSIKSIFSQEDLNKRRGPMSEQRTIDNLTDIKVSAYEYHNQHSTVNNNSEGTEYAAHIKFSLF